MDHALLMRVLDCLADAQHQQHARMQRQAVFVAPPGDRLAAQVLHHQIRLAVGIGPHVVDLRDRRVHHLRQQPALEFEQRTALRIQRIGGHQLDRHLALVRAIGTVAQIHLAHAAGADQAIDRPRTEARAGRQFR